MKPSNFIILYIQLILMLSLVNVSRNDTENYIIIQFNEETTLNDYPFFYFSSAIESIKYGDTSYSMGEEFSLQVNWGEQIKVYFNHAPGQLEFFLEGIKESISFMDFSNFNSSSLVTTNSLFSGFTYLESLDLTNFDTSKVTEMNSMFAECSSLKSLVLSSFDTSKVENMEFMFYQCSSLESLDLSNFDTSNVKYMQDIFEGCSSLKKFSNIKF